MQPLCLTFDNGPEPEVTPGVLAILARRRIPASFFLVGEKLRDPARLALAGRMRAEGFAVGNIRCRGTLGGLDTKEVGAQGASRDDRHAGQVDECQRRL